MSVALPSASSVRLLKLLPKEGPICDLNSKAARSSLLWMMTKSHFFSALNHPGNSTSLSTAIRARRDICLGQQFTHEPDKPVHLLAAGHGTARATIPVIRRALAC